MSADYQTRIPQLYRRLAPVYRVTRPFWAKTTNRAAEHYLENVVLPAVIRPSTEILDLGCGPASNLERLLRLNLPFAHYTGLDLSPGMLAQNPVVVDAKTGFVLGDSHWLPFASGSVDVVLSTWLFSHLPDPLKAAQEARRIMRPGGWLIVACFTLPTGLFGRLLCAIEPYFLMRCIRLEEIQTWPGLVEVKTFFNGINAVISLGK